MIPTFKFIFSNYTSFSFLFLSSHSSINRNHFFNYTSYLPHRSKLNYSTWNSFENSSQSIENQNLRVCFFGTDSVSLPTLKRLHCLQLQKKIKSLLVVCPEPPKTTKQKNIYERDHLVAQYCQENDIHLLRVKKKSKNNINQNSLSSSSSSSSSSPSSSSSSPSSPNKLKVRTLIELARHFEEHKNKIEEYSFDIGIVFSFGMILPPEIINLFNIGMFNIHPSLLPRHRGPAPLFYTILNNDCYSGISYITIHPSLVDHGNILYQSPVSVPPNIMFSEFKEEMSNKAANEMEFVLFNLKELINNSKPQSQLVGESYAKKIHKDDDCRVIWSKYQRTHIYNMWRAFSETFGIWTTWKNRRVLLRTLLPPSDSDSLLQDCFPTEAPVGSFYYDKKTQLIRIKTINTFPIQVSSLQCDGAKKLTAIEWSNGYKAPLSPQPDFCFE